MKRILISGASGFVGGHLARHYLDKGYEVVSILHDENPITTSKLLGIHDQINWCRGDILDQNFVKRVIAEYEVDEIAHLAAMPIVRVGTRTTIPIFQTNIMGTVNILEAMKEQYFSNCKPSMLYLNTDKSYGYAQSNKPYGEDTPLSGLNIYDVSKTCGELISQAYCHSFGIQITVARCCNVFGPADTNSRLIPNSIKRCIEGLPPIIFEGINYVREFINVDDACEAMMLLLDNINKTNGRAYNIGSGYFLNQEECINHILKYFPSLKPEYQKPPDYTRIEIPYQRLDTTRVERELGWKAKISFGDGLRKTIEFYKECLKQRSER